MSARPSEKKWMRPLATWGAVVILAGGTAFASPTRSGSRQLSEKQLIKESGYSGWRKKWANINQIGHRSLCGGLDFYSLQHQIAMGRQIAHKVIRTSRMIKDPIVTEYINRLGQNLVLNSDARVPYNFRVINSDVVNAFALPGGFVFVDSGLILHADDEAELASVLSHEIAHVAACHGAKQATKADIAQLAMIPLSVMLPYGLAGYGIYEGVNAAVPLAFLKFSREDESQADYLGLEYMYKAGYDPGAFVSFFEKVEKEDRRHPGHVAPFFSDHPTTPNRIRAIQKEMATILPPRREYVVDTSKFERVKHRLKLDESGRLVLPKKNKPTLYPRTRPAPTGRQKTAGKQTLNDNPPILKHRGPESW